MTGSMVALVTPFRANGEVDEETLRGLVQWHVGEGTDVLVPCGTTGESATLTHEEHVEVIRCVVEEAAGRVPILAGTGSNSTREAIELTKKAKAVGASAALVITPYYNKPPQRCLVSHFEAVVREGGLPIVVYNVPSRTGCNLLPETMAQLAENPGVIGLKDASGDLTQTADTVELCGDRITVLSGEDFLTLPMLSVGGKGAISVVANLAPKRCKKLMTSFFSGKIEEAKQIHYELLPLARACFLPGEVNPIGVKMALSEMGHLEPVFRLPLEPLGEERKEMLRSLLQKGGVL